MEKKLTATAIHFWVAISASILKPGVNLAGLNWSEKIIHDP